MPLLFAVQFSHALLAFPSNTRRLNKYFWCSRFCESYCKPIKWVSIQNIAPNIHWSPKTFRLSQVNFRLLQSCTVSNLSTPFSCIFQLVATFPERTFSEILRQQTGLLRESTNVGAVWPSHRSSSRNQKSKRISQQMVVMESLPNLLLFIDFLLTGLKHSSSCCFFHSSLLRQRKPATFFAGNIRQYFPAQLLSNSSGH